MTLAQIVRHARADARHYRRTFYIYQGEFGWLHTEKRLPEHTYRVRANGELQHVTGHDGRKTYYRGVRGL